MLAAGICILGGVSVGHIPVGLLPNLASPGITIITRYPGVEAVKIEEILTIPIERQLSDISEIETIISVSSEGESKVNLVFDHRADIKIKILEATEKIFYIRGRFPREVQEPSVIQYDPGDRPVFIVSFESDSLDLKELRELVDLRVKAHFERIDGVSEVYVGGGYDREIQIIADPDRFAAGGAALDRVSSYLSALNRYTPGGLLPGQPARALYTEGRYGSIGEIRRTLIRLDAEKPPVSILDFADVVDGFRDRDTISRTDGKERVTIYIQKAGSANTLEITDEAEKITGSIDRRQLRVFTNYNQGSFIRTALNSVIGSCISGALIAVMILYAFLRNAKLTLLIALTIPCCMMATFFLMFMAGIEINVISLSGLALGGGMLIDNSIVVSEAFESALKNGTERPIFDEALSAVSRISGEVVSATLATVIVFIPLIFTDPQTRKLYYGLSMTVTISLLVSIVFSLTVLPSFMLFIFSRRTAQAPQAPFNRPSFLFKLSQFKWSMDIGRLSRLIHSCTLPLYRHIRAVMIGVLVFIVLTPFLVLQLKKEGLNPAESGEIEANIDLTTGTHLEKTETIIGRIEESLKKNPFVESVSSRIEKWHASLHIKLNADGRLLRQNELIESLRTASEPHREAFVHYTGSSEAQSIHELDIDFFGDDNTKLKEFAAEASTIIQSGVPGIEQVILRFREPKDGLKINLDRTKAAQSGTSVSEIGSQLRGLISGSIITKFYDGQREVDVRFAGEKEALSSPENIRAMNIALAGRAQPLSTLASFQEDTSETRLWRKNKRKTVTITIKTTDRSLDQTAEDIVNLFRTINFPADTVYSFGDDYRRMENSQKEMALAVLLSILIIYLMLGALFESLLQPLIILLPVPLTWTGILCFLFAANSALNMSVYIGMIMLGGIVVNQSILVLATINHFVLNTGHFRSGTELMRKILRASTNRLRPIIMTALTTIAGMLPMVFDTGDGSHLWRPLALTVTLGLGISLFISLALVPLSAYLYYYRFFNISRNGVCK